MDRKTEMEAVELGLTGVANARRVAGYPAAGGRKVRGERLLRTGALGGASAEDLQRLIRYQVKYVVDFRTSFEKAGAPDLEIPGAVHLDIPILEESGDSAAGAAAAGGMADPAKAILQYALSGKLENLYLDMAMSAFSQQGFKRFFDLLLDCREGAVLWHCTGGKDRTGLAGYLLLYTLGVPEADCMEDFLLSNRFLQDSIEAMDRMAVKEGCTEAERAAVRSLAGVNRDYLQKALDGIRARYGSLDRYLEERIGLDAEKVRALRDGYLA